MPHSRNRRVERTPRHIPPCSIALAASSGLDVRTIQRIKAGQGASVTTRRCLARGLGYEKPDTFDAPEFVMHVHKLLENAQGTPVSLEVGYLTVVPTENVLEDMFVPRRCRLSF
jgi:hypothetical protein